MEHYSSELLSDFGLSGWCKNVGDLVAKVTMFGGDVKIGKEPRTLKSFDDVIFGKFIVAIDNWRSTNVSPWDGVLLAVPVEETGSPKDSYLICSSEKDSTHPDRLTFRDQCSSQIPGHHD